MCLRDWFRTRDAGLSTSSSCAHEACSIICNRMVTDTPVFAALADPIRRTILDLVRVKELSAGQIAERFDVSRPAVSRHIRVLKAAQLLNERRDAQSRFYTARPESLRGVDAWLEHYRVFWTARLHEIKTIAESIDTPPGTANQ